MNPMLSIFIAIISLMPAIIFVIFFKILLTILNRGKKNLRKIFMKMEEILKTLKI